MTIGSDTLLSDDFNRSDGPLGSNWIDFPDANEGAFGVVSNKARLTAGVGGSQVRGTYVNPALLGNANVDIQALFDHPNGNRRGLFVRVSNIISTTNFSGYYLGRDNTQAVIARNVGGTETELSNVYKLAWDGVWTAPYYLRATADTVGGDVVLTLYAKQNVGDSWTEMTTFTDTDGTKVLEGSAGITVTGFYDISVPYTFDDVILIGTAPGGGVSIPTISHHLKMQGIQ